MTKKVPWSNAIYHTQQKHVVDKKWVIATYGKNQP